MGKVRVAEPGVCISRHAHTVPLQPPQEEEEGAAVRRGEKSPGKMTWSGRIAA